MNALHWLAYNCDFEGIKRLLSDKHIIIDIN
jgi:hypothetical protein